MGLPAPEPGALQHSLSTTTQDGATARGAVPVTEHPEQSRQGIPISCAISPSSSQAQQKQSWTPVPLEWTTSALLPIV